MTNDRATEDASPDVESKIVCAQCVQLQLWLEKSLDFFCLQCLSTVQVFDCAMASHGEVHLDSHSNQDIHQQCVQDYL